jgi:hypothetical protein
MDNGRPRLARQAKEPAGVAYALQDAERRTPGRHPGYADIDAAGRELFVDGPGLAHHDRQRDTVPGEPIREVEQLPLLAVDRAAASEEEHAGRPAGASHD